jgi:large subunit ribosomal protein L7Ae
MRYKLHVSEGRESLSKTVETVNNNFNERWEKIRKLWGGGIMSTRRVAHMTKIEKARLRS